MPCLYDGPTDDGGDGDDGDFDDDFDAPYGGDSDPTEADCPYCGRPVYDDAERCPSCGSYLSREDAPRSRPWWLVLGVVVCLLVVLMWVVR